MYKKTNHMLKEVQHKLTFIDFIDRDLNENEIEYLFPLLSSAMLELCEIDETKYEVSFTLKKRG